MVLFSILSEIDENNFHFDEELFPHYTRMIGMVDNFEFIAGHTSEFSKSPKIFVGNSHRIHSDNDFYFKM